MRRGTPLYLIILLENRICSFAMSYLCMQLLKQGIEGRGGKRLGSVATSRVVSDTGGIEQPCNINLLIKHDDNAQGRHKTTKQGKRIPVP